MARLHRKYTKDAFDPHLLELTLRLVKEKPWNHPLVETQEHLLGVWAHGVEVVLGVPSPIVRIAPQNGPQRLFVGRYEPAAEPRKAVVRLHRCSLISLLHNYRHHMQALGGQDLNDPEVAQEAQEWACSLFYTVAPRRFRKAVRAGRIAGVYPADLLKRKVK